MADNKWTKEQLNAIELRNRRLLVSAAAGSGKTAVLVERIIRRILDAENPVDVDRLLVVTFTKAAAAEMKERIRKRLIDAVDSADTEAEVRFRLKEQIAVLDSASIQTIDSFCMSVVRDHSDELSIDPNVRVAEDAELTLIKADVMEELLEDCYEKADENFINFAEAFGQGTAGSNIDEKILQIFRFAQVTEKPEEWYDRQLDESGTESFASYIFENMRELVSSYVPELEKLIALCGEPGGPQGYVKTLTQDIEFLDAVSYTRNYTQLCEVMRSYEWPAIGRKSKNDNEAIAERVKTERESIKKKIKAWTSDYTREAGEAEEEQKLTAPYIKTLIELAREFDHRFSDRKREKNVIDFNDLEHMALKVLENDPDFGNRFDEIYVDEYQDTNDIQEAIVKALDNGRVFMVGDVKQSIYRFRQAKPEIFMKKYECFERVENSDAGTDTLIELSQNFRSRNEVLDSVNRLFRTVMVKKLGGVAYTKEAELNPGAEFGEFPDRDACGWNHETEMLLANVGDIDEEDSSHAAEARLIARKIAQLTDPGTGMPVWDKETKEYRKAQFSDIVILLRSANSSGDVYLNTLLDAGIPAYCETNKGYFDSLEVRTMIAMLTAIDNPRKDIPLAAFLHSPVIGMTDDDLAVYRKARELLTGTAKYKLELAEEMLARYRKMSRYMSISDLITKIYDETGYYEYASTLPAGKVRRANLDKLRDMAAEYAGTGYKGLFNFLRYIENLKAYDTDFGEASALGEKDDLVRIMSIHKSKGLEFPIVFLANSEKRINQKDSDQPVLVDSELGAGCVYVDTAERFKKKTLKQMALRLKLRNETIGEELRILYVAMTRAKEKLFITGTVKDPDKFIMQYENAPSGERPLPLSKLRSDNGYLYWIVESGVRYRYDIAYLGEDVERGSFENEGRIRKYLSCLTVDPQKRDELDRIFGFEYPHNADVDLQNKVSISELKRLHMEEIMQGAQEIEYNYLPEIKDEVKIGGAERGTIYHEVMEKLDYASPELNELPDCVKRSDIEAFIASGLGQEFRSASAEGRLFRERQFIMGVPARELKLADSDENVLVQGIIDAYIEYDDGICLVDYKTDRVSDANELTDRYESQLYYYAMALEKMKNKKVTRKIIWSFALGRAIELA